MKRLIVLFVFISVFAFSIHSESEVVERIVAKVNDDIVTLTELNQMYLPVVEKIKKSYPPSEWEKEILKVKVQALNELVDEYLLVQKAEELGIKISDAELQRAIEKLKEDNNIKTDEELIKALKEQGEDLDSLKEKVRRSLLIMKLQERELRDKVKVTEREARAYYEENIDKYRLSGGYHLLHILIKYPEDKNALAMKRFEDKVKEVESLLEKGEDFEKVAKKYSDSPTVDIGIIPLSKMRPEFAEVVKKMKIGEVSPPFKNEFGVNFIKIKDYRSESVKPFSEVKDSIVKILREKKLKESIEQYLIKLREEAFIEKYL